MKFKYSFNIGSSIISGGTCNGQNLDLNNQKNLGMTVTDGAGVTIHMQAYTETGASCGTSNRVPQTLNR